MTDSETTIFVLHLYKENNGNSKTWMHELMKMKFLAITNYFFTQILPYLPMVLCEVNTGNEASQYSAGLSILKLKLSGWSNCLFWTTYHWTSNIQQQKFILSDGFSSVGTWMHLWLHCCWNVNALHNFCPWNIITCVPKEFRKSLKLGRGSNRAIVCKNLLGIR